MPLAVETFRHEGSRHEGTTLFKALGHPVAAERARDLMPRLRDSGPIAVVDPDGAAESFAAFYSFDGCEIGGVYVQNVADVGRAVLGKRARPLSDLAGTTPGALFVAAFDAPRPTPHLAALTPGAAVFGFDDLRIDDDWLSNPRRYLDPLNFATNFAFLRDGGGHHTAIRSANYWGGYGAADPELWCCLFSEDGGVLARWHEDLPAAGGTFTIDSREVRARFGLGDFIGSLFLHALRVRGHSVVKYALDTFGDDGTVLSATHDANSWPSDYYAGLPAPADGERVVLWVQNSHPIPIPAGNIGVSVMGSDDISWHPEPIAPFATSALDAGALAPEARWPQQLEITAGRYFVRPRYEIVRGGRSRIAHANVERTDLVPDPELAKLGAHLGKGFLLPLPVLPTAEYTSTVLPTPMARGQRELPLEARLYDRAGAEVRRSSLGVLPRGHADLVDVDQLLGGGTLEGGYGHLELLYDFARGVEADGWLHALARFEDRATGHAAETSFGAHIYNILDVYKSEPQSYAGPPPGLSTRLFLRVGPAPLQTFCHLIYPASKPWLPHSDTALILMAADGAQVSTEKVAIPCSGSLLWRVDEIFDATTLAQAGDGAYVLVRDTTCRLFGFHGLRTAEAFSFDHMFGF
jgi:hypothetical protein